MGECTSPLGERTPPLGKRNPPLGERTPPLGDCSFKLGVCVPPTGDYVPPMGTCTSPTGDCDCKGKNCDCRRQKLVHQALCRELSGESYPLKTVSHAGRAIIAALVADSRHFRLCVVCRVAAREVEREQERAEHDGGSDPEGDE